MVDRRHRGHGQHLKTVKRLAMPMRTSAQLGKVPIRSHALLWLHNRLHELKSASKKAQGGIPMLQGLAAVALHDAGTWKEEAVSRAAAS